MIIVPFLIGLFFISWWQIQQEALLQGQKWER